VLIPQGMRTDRNFKLTKYAPQTLFSHPTFHPFHPLSLPSLLVVLPYPNVKVAGHRSHQIHNLCYRISNMPNFTPFLVLLCLSSSRMISLVAAVPSEGPVHPKLDIIVATVGPAEQAHSPPGNTEGSLLQVQSLHSEFETDSDGSMKLFSDRYDFNPTPSHSVVQPDEGSGPPSGSISTDDSSFPAIASKTVSLDPSDQGLDDEDRSPSPFDHYHVLGTRPGSSDSTLEKRRICPA
jgi:hypothetical protein